MIVKIADQAVNGGGAVRLGVERDNLVRRLVFVGVPVIGGAQTVTLLWLAERVLGETTAPGDIEILTQTAEGYVWDVDSRITQYAGRKLTAYLQVNTPDGREWHTEGFRLTAAALPDIEQTVTEPEITAIGQMLAEITAHRAEMAAQIDHVEGMVDEAGAALGEVEVLADQVREDAQGVAADKDATQTAMQTAIQHALGAYDSMVAAGMSRDQAAQALSDLIAMLGSQIATLGTDGKLTPSQIPPLSINDVFPVSTASEMLTLTAERGDVALVMDSGVVTDSYMLAADDPAQAANWKKLGVSYVANAGHAATSDSATDAERINGKRIISMTQEQYDNAVTDPDTLYAVATEVG